MKISQSTMDELIDEVNQRELDDQLLTKYAFSDYVNVSIDHEMLKLTISEFLIDARYVVYILRRSVDRLTFAKIANLLQISNARALQIDQAAVKAVRFYCFKHLRKNTLVFFSGTKKKENIY